MEDLLQNAKKMFFVQVLQKRFHLNVHIIGFRPKTQKLEPPSIKHSGSERSKKGTLF